AHTIIKAGKLIFRFFRENKVDISSVITQPFPFLMGLRDRSFIPEQMYEVRKHIWPVSSWSLHMAGVTHF
uniref:HSR domain-containing protein n=1 Tax=Sus scrofa TaxID=9823 RepID=A0A4X1V1S3_PIG